MRGASLSGPTALSVLLLACSTRAHGLQLSLQDRVQPTRLGALRRPVGSAVAVGKVLRGGMTRMALFDSLGVAASTDASALLLGRDVACAVFCAVAAKFWVSFWSDLAAADRIDSKLSRKLIHTGSAPLFMLCWPLFSDAPTARILASAVPMIQIIRLYRAGQATASDAADGRPGNEAALVKAISRSGERAEALGGPFLYTVVLFTATALGWRSPIAAAAVCQMAVGDGIADIFGRRYGKIKWPFSKSKSLVGSAAFVAGGFTSSVFFVALFHACGFTTLTASGTAPALLLVSLASAVVELLPSELADDNLSVPLFACAVSALLLGSS